MIETISLTLEKTELRPVYGGQKLSHIYEVSHLKNGIGNTYVVEVEMRGLNEAEPYLDWTSASINFRYHNNEETLTDDAILQKIEDRKEL